MYERLINFDYHRELIEILINTRLPSFIVGVIAPVMFFLVFKNIPETILYSLTISHFILFLIRFFVSTNTLKNLCALTDEELKKRLKLVLLTIFLANLLWCLSIIFTSFYSDTLYVFILLTALLAIISGAMTTITSVFHAVFFYLITIIPTFIFTLLFFGDQLVHYIAVIFLTLYLFILLKASYQNYKLLESSISQKKEIQLLNQTLEEKVKKAIEDTEQKEKQLQEQSRMAQMGEMISMIAHQWRQPLSSISSTIINLKVKMALESPNIKNQEDLDSFFGFIDEEYDNISDYVQFLSTTIDDFRDFFKHDKPKETVNLTNPIEKALHITKTYSNHNIAISKDFQNNDLLSIYTNEITQVILNIIKNAEDNFIQKNITDAHIHISTKKDNDNDIITISDNGGGIPENILKNIFDPYFSTKAEKNGTGLGLYMSKIIVEQHNGGKLNVFNIENGVMFEIIL